VQLQQPAQLLLHCCHPHLQALSSSLLLLLAPILQLLALLLLPQVSLQAWMRTWAAAAAAVLQARCCSPCPAAVLRLH
jgi:hypothetical protein